LNTDAVHLFNPNIPAMLGGIVWVLFVAYIFEKEKESGLVLFSLIMITKKIFLNSKNHCGGPG